MKDYDRTFSGTSITTGQWRSHLFHFFGNQPNGQEYLRALGKVDWDEVSRSNMAQSPSATDIRGEVLTW